MNLFETENDPLKDRYENIQRHVLIKDIRANEHELGSFEKEKLGGIDFNIKGILKDTVNIPAHIFSITQISGERIIRVAKVDNTNRMFLKSDEVDIDRYIAAVKKQKSDATKADIINSIINLVFENVENNERLTHNPEMKERLLSPEITDRIFSKFGEYIEIIIAQKVFFNHTNK